MPYEEYEFSRQHFPLQTFGKKMEHSYAHTSAYLTNGQLFPGNKQ